MLAASAFVLKTFVQSEIRIECYKENCVMFGILKPQQLKLYRGSKTPGVLYESMGCSSVSPGIYI